MRNFILKTYFKIKYVTWSHKSKDMVTISQPLDCYIWIYLDQLRCQVKIESDKDLWL